MAQQTNSQPVDVLAVGAAEVEAACRAMWASWGRMRPDHERKHREAMRRSLEAAALARAQGGA